MGVFVAFTTGDNQPGVGMGPTLYASTSVDVMADERQRLPLVMGGGVGAVVTEQHRAAP